MQVLFSKAGEVSPVNCCKLALNSKAAAHPCTVPSLKLSFLSPCVSLLSPEGCSAAQLHVPFSFSAYGKKCLTQHCELH